MQKILDYGSIDLIDIMGDDQAICDAARISYGKGTKTVSKNRGLIRYLMRHKHTSPFEMAEVKFYIKAPISVARQWIRHRTANVNEYSARYSELLDNIYIPAMDRLRKQSTTNMQGSGELLSEESRKRISKRLEILYETATDIYEKNLIDGLSREVARGCLPVDIYTEFFWKNDLHNTMHFLNLRMDKHAQWEIRQYANAMYNILKPLFPLAFEAFDDYVSNAVTVSAQEYRIIKEFMSDLDNYNFDKSGLSEREVKEFKITWN